MTTLSELSNKKKREENKERTTHMFCASATMDQIPNNIVTMTEYRSLHAGVPGSTDIDHHNST